MQCDEFADISSRLVEVIEEFYVKSQIRFDIIIYGKSSKTSKIINGIGKLNLGKFAHRINTVNASKKKKYLKLNVSALVLVSSSNFLWKAVNNMFVLNYFNSPVKHLVYCHNLNKSFLKKYPKEMSDVFSRTAISHYFLTNETKSYELLTFERFKSGKIYCKRPELITINKFSKNSSKWSKKFADYQKHTNYNNCTLTYSDRATQSPNFYLSKYTSRPQGFHVDLIEIVSIVKNFKVDYIIKKYSATDDEQHIALGNADVELTQAFNNIVSATQLQITTTFKQVRYRIVITPGELVTNYEKLFLPFDEVTWTMLIITFGIAFGTIIVLNFLPKTIRHIVYGEGVRTPSLNIFYIFL